MSHIIDPAVVTHDEARMELCHRIAKAIREGESGIQVRFLHPGDTITEAWVYTQSYHDWKKRDDLALSNRLLTQMYDLFEGLFSQKYTDAWTHHRTDHADRSDFELKFHRDVIESHLKGDLESYLNGCLNHAHHDSGLDSRRRMGFRGRNSV